MNISESDIVFFLADIILHQIQILKVDLKTLICRLTDFLNNVLDITINVFFYFQQEVDIRLWLKLSLVLIIKKNKFPLKTFKSITMKWGINQQIYLRFITLELLLALLYCC